MKRFQLAGGVSLTVFCFMAAPGAANAAAIACSVEAIQKVATADTTITSAAQIMTPVPHCRVEGYVRTQNPGPNRNNFRLQLPDTGWANRYYFIGLGGAGGFVPTDSQIPAGNPMRKGFAVAGGDVGHEAPVWDYSFMNDPAKSLDFAGRGGHVTAVATQQITKRYYGTERLFRYQSGCSGGGRMAALSMAQYPQDYDGALAGGQVFSPAFDSDVFFSFILMARELSREPGAFVTPAKFRMADRQITEQCDALDGVRDGIVTETARCRAVVDFARFTCAKGRDDANCLTVAERRTIEAIVAGPQGRGGPLAPGWPISHISTWTMYSGDKPPPWPTVGEARKLPPEQSFGAIPAGYNLAATIAEGFFGAGYNALTDFDFRDPKQVEAWHAASRRTGYGLARQTDLSGLAKTGGKVIFWSGLSDPAALASTQIAYYEAAAKSVGGLEPFSHMARLYLTPGAGHCGGGAGPADAPDVLLDALIAWVEEGRAPQGVVAHRGTGARSIFANAADVNTSNVSVPPPQGDDREFLLCPYPQKAVLQEKGASPKVAANWSCKL